MIKTEKPIIYLDHAASTPPVEHLLFKHYQLCRQYYANPHNGHCVSEKIMVEVRKATSSLCAELAIQPMRVNIVWTSGGTEAINLAILGMFTGKNGGGCAVDATSHLAAINSAMSIKNSVLFPVDDKGFLDLQHATKIVPKNINLISVCMVNNETGVVQDLPVLRKWMNKNTPNALLMVDAVQALTKFDIPWQTAQIDLLALSARKIGGPTSMGVLIYKNNIELKPLLYGGVQQNCLRPGTLDAVSVIEFAETVSFLIKKQDNYFAQVQTLNDYTRKKILALNKYTPQIISPVSASPYILSISFPNYEGAIIMRALAEQGILIGKGSACTAESKEISHVAKAMQLSQKVAKGIIRISFNHNNSKVEIDQFITALNNILLHY